MWKLILNTNFRSLKQGFGGILSHLFLWLLLEILLVFPFVSQDPTSVFFLFDKLLLAFISLDAINHILKQSPLQLPKQLYLLPVSENERVRLLLIPFCIRICWLFILMILFTELTVCSLYYDNSLPCLFVQTALMIFSIWALLLRKGIYGILLPDSLEEVHTRAESMVSIYSIFIFLAEYAVFWITYVMDIYQNYPAAWFCWIPILILNAAVIQKCTIPVLKKAASFEEVYTQK